MPLRGVAGVAADAYSGGMNASSESSLFRPGAGGLPPYLAGREREQRICREFLDELRQGRPPPREIILYGPRGNGKTALLAWLQQEVRRCADIDAIRLTPSAVRSEEQLAERLAAPAWWQRLLPGEISVRGFKLRWPSVLGGRLPALDEMLAARARKKPLLLLLDEAHTLDKQVGHALLNASQIIGREQPFLLALAGTPDLKSRLSAMGASFWSRAALLPVGRLAVSAAEAALREPLAGENVAIDDDALAHVVAASHGYPYFVQLWGDALWRRICAGDRRVSWSMVQAAQADFDREKNSYYLERYEELRRQRLLPAARAVAEAFENEERLDDAQLAAAVRRGLDGRSGSKRARAAMETLGNLGYVWRPDAVPTWEAGIPSLMDYMRSYAPSSAS